MRSTNSKRAVRFTAAAIVAAALAAVFGVSTAAAHTATLTSTVSLSFSPPAAFAGRVSAADSTCVAARSVTLYRDSGSESAQPVAATTTAASGEWLAQLPSALTGTFSAVVATSVATSPRHRHTCRAATSNAVTVTDADGDGVVEPGDNCPSVANPGQEDLDGDRYGNACDADADGDAFTAPAGDCDDLDASRHPGAPETTQNAIDDDCDGLIDEDYSSGVVCTDSVGCGWNPEPVVPPECANLTDEDYALWLAYVSWVNGYGDTDPGLTPEQIALYQECYVPFDGF